MIYVNLNFVNLYHIIRMWTKKEAIYAYTIFTSSKRSMNLLNRKTQFKNIYRKVYRNVPEAIRRSLSYRNKYKVTKPLRIGQKVLFGKS